MSLPKKIIGTGVVLTTCFVAWKYDALYDITLHNPTTQEVLIEDALSKTYGIDETVRCLSQEEINDRTWPFDQNISKRGTTLSFFSLIMLDNVHCAALESFADREDKISATHEELRAIHVLAHESRHELGTSNEMQADCEAIQTSPDLARTLGADTVIAQAVGEQVARLAANEEVPEYSLIDCYDNGPFDLDPSNPGVFPR